MSATATAAITEAADASAQDLSDSGTVSFSDIDTNDVIDIGFASDNNIAWSGGTIDADAGHAAGERVQRHHADRCGGTRQHRLELHGSRCRTWIFWMPARPSRFSYTVTATDNNGATDSDTVSFTITGTNDAPERECHCDRGDHRSGGRLGAGSERQRHGEFQRHRYH